MNIQSNPVYYTRNTTSFTGAAQLSAKMSKIIPNTKVCKNLTSLDKVCFNEYINFKSHKLGITAEDVAELSKYDGENFLIASYEYLTKKMGFSQEIRPTLYFAPIQEKGIMAYDPATNIILADSQRYNSLKIKKASLFGALRHELQHYLHNANILRHETFAPQAMDLLTQKFVAFQQAACIDILKNNSMEVITSCGQFTPEQLEIFRKAKICLDNKDTEGFNKLFTGIAKDYRNNLEALAGKIRKELGIIKADSSLTPKIQKTFEELQGGGYYKPNKDIDYKQYFDHFIENDAIQKQSYAEFEFSQEPCFIKYMKNAAQEALKDERNKEILEAMG